MLAEITSRLNWGNMVSRWFENNRTPKRFTPSRRSQPVPDNLWVKCSDCREAIYRRQLEDNHRVCPCCGFHFHLPTREWIDVLADRGSFREHGANQLWLNTADNAVQSKNQNNNGRQPAEQHGSSEAIVWGMATVEGLPLVMQVLNWNALDVVHTEAYTARVIHAVEHALEQHVPLVTVNNSHGAGQSAALLSTLQFARIALALMQHAAARHPHIAVLGNLSDGNSFASFVWDADVILGEPGLRISLDTLGGITHSIRRRLYASCRLGELLVARGKIDQVVSRPALRHTLAGLLRIYAAAN